MKTAKALPAEFEIDPARIRQQTFEGVAGTLKAPLSPSTLAGFSVEFARSGKTSTAAEGDSRGLWPPRRESTYHPPAAGPVRNLQDALARRARADDL
jgi:hypothetical protein